MSEIATNHHASLAWDAIVGQIRDEIRLRKVDPCATVVLVPYAQLMQVARDAWARTVHKDACSVTFMPRFETTSNWCRHLGGFEPAAHDLHHDAARDLLSATILLRQAGLGRQHGALAGRLVESAWTLSHVAAAVPPARRAAWADAMTAAMAAPDPDSPTHLEGWLGRIAIAWAANSAYPTDSILEAQPELLVLVEGFQPEPMHATLRERLGAACMVLALNVGAAVGTVALHAARDAEDEAERASACVLQHLASGRTPVALVAQDRFLMRRMRSLLGERGVVVRDETGWTLSTTRAATTVMAALRAVAWDASGDQVLDWLKNSPAFDAAAVSGLEALMRAGGMRDWRDVPLHDGVAAQARALQAGMQAARTIGAWLAELRGLLQRAGQWDALLHDSAGQAVLDALRLREAAQDDFADFNDKLSQATFMAWLGQVLEQGSFVPTHPDGEQVIILPLTQLLGRSPAAVVFPGCDEDRFALSPDTVGLWTRAQRVLLGLPSREALAAVTRSAWQGALGCAHVDILWRCSHDGEACLPGMLVQELLLGRPERANDPRVKRFVECRPGQMPRPRAQAVVPTSLSASAYDDLRSCPYRFFAMRMLRLRTQDELDVGVDKRDFGLWLHGVLKLFHEALATAPTSDEQGRRDLMDAAAQAATRSLGLSAAEFLPFSAAWPRTRASYLQWLSAHEATGAAFAAAEVERRLGLGTLQLVGRLDRLDRCADGSTLVLDYKTERRETTAARVKPGNDDIQLAFYAALLHDDRLDAQYLSLGDTTPAQTFRQPDVIAQRDMLVDAIRGDMQRIASGAQLPALGQAQACTYCDARGLCRKDYWELGEQAVPSDG